MRKQIACARRGVIGLLVAGLVVVTGSSVHAADPNVLAAKTPAPAAKKPLCASSRDMQGLDVRVLQTELMVAALTCGDTAKERYNRFITAYQPALADRSDALRGYFRRAYGGQGEFYMNAFVTRMANDSSTQSWKIRDDYCGFADNLFDEVLNGNPRDLNQVAAKDWIKQRHGIPACQ